MIAATIYDLRSKSKRHYAMASMNDDLSSLEAEITTLTNLVNSDTDELSKLNFRARIRELKATVDDLLSPYYTLNVEEWDESHRGLFSASTDGTEISQSTLPKVGGTQSGGKRRRIEQNDFVLIRQPLFQEYENSIFNDQSLNFRVLTGPQGFGKSVFLHYLATKRAFNSDHIVVFAPVAIRKLISFKEALGRAFYRGCAAQKLANVPFMKRSDTVPESLSRMRQFAFDREKKLVIIVDQLKLSLEYFTDTVDEMQSFAANATDGHVVILSSSTSGRVGNVFGDDCNYLTPFFYPLQPSEVDLIVTTFEEAPSNSAFARESRTSFLQTMAILSGNDTTVDDMADRFVNSLFSRLREVESALASEIRAEYMRVLTTVVAKDEYDTPLACSFNPELVDGEKFFAWEETPASKFTMREFMHGFASMVLALIKIREDIKYDQFLLSIVGTPSFQKLARGAQGIILEDCFGVIMQDKQKPVKFMLTQLSGHTGVGIIRTVAVDKRFVFHCGSPPPARR